MCTIMPKIPTSDNDLTTEFVPLFMELLDEIVPADFRWRSEVVEGGGHVHENSIASGIGIFFGDR